MLQKEDQKNTMCLGSVRAMAEMGSNAAAATPLLKEMFEKETRWPWRCNYAADLYEIDSQQTEAFDFIMGGLTNWNNSVQIGLAAYRTTPDWQG